MTTVYIHGQPVRLNKKNLIGEGGEAEIYRLSPTEVVKLYKSRTHPDFASDTGLQQAVEKRLAEHQIKLPAFPKNLPERIVVPTALAYDSAGRIVGYVMPLVYSATEILRLSQKSFRQGVPNPQVIRIFEDLRETVVALHRRHNLVIGDFNDLNVLVRGLEAFLIDTDSMQFGSFLCTTFTDRFVDPRLCQIGRAPLMLTRPHTAESDWYAFAVMLMQSLLFVGPYGGIYLPKDPQRKLSDAERVHGRITIFHPEVRYPKPAIHFRTLSDELLDYFERTFVKDQRGEFPDQLLTSLTWKKCDRCGLEHARQTCPICQQTPEAAVTQVMTVRGRVTATRVFTTRGSIIRANVWNDKLHVLHHEDGALRRENGEKILDGPFDPSLRYRLLPKATALGKDGQIVILKNGAVEHLCADNWGSMPIFDTNENGVFWIDQGRLQRQDEWAPMAIGEVLANQSIFWVGNAFGLGFYRAGGLTVGFVFSTLSRGLNDTVKLPAIRGQLIDASCVFSDNLAWLTTKAQEKGKTVTRLTVVNSLGRVEASLETEGNSEPWLSSTRGAGAVGSQLFVPTDDGIVRVEIVNHSLAATRVFPDTENFVDASTRILPAQNGLYAVRSREITFLTIR
ncbi:MAG: hypothetical protein UX09_C0029G0002 [Candidatus Uhrbacteria bacterium GW2011_GWE2_45_35]|uniref:Protein kinase domain-containing protein n=1 Tax=Candidatus Uhrbacteria bacterium GW2011_GWE2_45_35 TaxID=1618993 RepID=A0A0G1PPW4_9BACT|nr:MAG: hypothetical protein UX09_C0029G0002 [Candidatus Uhrbacteria bacterium GW2011_GWE2_45_35]